jgi:signal transduction histidine kinase
MLSEEHQAEPVAQFPERRQAWRRHEDRKLRQRERELDAARRICQALSQHINVDELVVRVLRTALDVVGAESGSVLLADFDTKQLVFRYVIGEKWELLQDTAIPWDEGIAGAVFTSGQEAVIGDVKQDRRHYAGIDELTGYRTRDMITLPLKRWGGEPIGVLQVLNKREGRLDQDDLAILTIVSAISAEQIELARLFQEAKLAAVVRFLGDINHDLKNMLQPVVCGAELLQTELDEHFTSLPEKYRGTAQPSRNLCNEVIDMVRGNAWRIQDRVRGIADCIKGLSTPPQFAPCRVAEVVDSVFKTLRVLADEKQVLLLSEGLGKLPTIVADERRLFNAFYNLVHNAIPEVSSDGSITVQGWTDHENQVIFLAVIDTGRGMPPEVLESLFTTHAISRKAGGTGLGTKIVKDVVDAHGGNITVESKEGIGTTFVIRLPIRPSQTSGS